MTEQPTKVRFDAIYIAAAGSESLVANTANMFSQTAAGPYGAAKIYEATALDSWTNGYGGATLLPAQNVISSNSAFVSMPSLWRTDASFDYQELGHALGELSESSDDEWRIDKPVYNVARHVAAELMQESYPAPKLFIHGAKSVVFFWAEGNNNIYLTVSEDHISGLVSSPEEIQLRFEFPQTALPAASILFPAIRTAVLWNTQLGKLSDSA